MSTKPAATLTDRGRARNAPGRPAEIEDPTNRLLVHPAARALVDRLVATPATPNQVSVASVAAALGAGACILALPWPWDAPAALACLFAWHVLDGADGQLARRTGRASPIGELVDGVCDHASQLVVYLALGLLLQRGVGARAWAWAAAAGASHFLQANAYESLRKTYRRWVYGTRWMRQELPALEARGWAARLLGRLYMAVSRAGEAGESALEAAMENAPPGAVLYRERFAPLIRQSVLLDANSRTLAVFASLLAGSPVWFFAFEATVLNAVLVRLLVARRARNAALVRRLSAG